MAKKFENVFSEQEKIQDESDKNLMEQLKIELEKFGLKIVTDENDDKKIKVEVAEPKKIQNNPVKVEIEQLRIELAKLGLKIIDELNGKRVSKPEETYNSLVALYNAIKY